MKKTRLNARKKGVSVNKNQIEADFKTKYGTQKDFMRMAKKSAKAHGRLRANSNWVQAHNGLKAKGVMGINEFRM